MSRQESGLAGGRLRQPFSLETRFRVLLRDGFRCRYCGVGSSVAAIEIDHVIPVAAGGGPEESNLITSCFECNAGKRTIDLALGVSRDQSDIMQISESTVHRFRNQIADALIECGLCGREPITRRQTLEDFKKADFVEVGERIREIERKRLMREYRKKDHSETTVADFITDCCVLAENKCVTFKDLYAVYLKWTAKNEIVDIGPKRFSTVLSKMDGITRVGLLRKLRQRGFTGIDLKFYEPVGDNK